MTYLIDGLQQGLGQTPGPVAVAFKQMIGHPLTGLWPDTGQTAQRIDQAVNQD